MSALKKAGSIVFLIWGFLTFISAMILVLPFIVICSALFKGKTSTDLIFFFLKIWGSIFCILAFYPIRSKKDPDFDPSKAYIYVCNHNSYLDAVAVVISIPGSFKPLGKIEMVKIPVFGIIYKRVAVMIDRASKESRARSVEELKADLANGQSILIFPEGTMNRTDKPLTDFYDGAFRLAIETQTPIAPLAIINARNLFPRNNPLAVRPGIITCIFDKPIEVKGLVAEDLESLKARVYQRMETLIVNAG
jgi:1-acyl-sn-glycerol-3-phosphate acyltransferase